MPIRVKTKKHPYKTTAKKIIVNKLDHRLKKHAKEFLNIAQKKASFKSENLANSLFLDYKNDKIKIGTNLNYGFFLEFGTIKMSAKPWFSPALEEFKKAILQKRVF